jgi:hypothetical protein
MTAQTARLDIAPRPAPTLGERDLERVADAIADIAPDWTVELAGADRVDLSLVVMPEDADDELGPTYVIWRDGGSVRLDQYHRDVVAPLASRPDMGDILRLLRGYLGMAAVPRHAARH